MLKPWASFADALVQTEPEVTVSYRTANMVYEEGLRDGSLIALSYNAAGYLMDANPLGVSYMRTAQFAKPWSFELCVDGQDLVSHWTYVSFDTQKKDGNVACALRLRHAVRPVEVIVKTLLDGTPVMRRSIEIVNLSDRPAAVSQLAPLSGGLQTARVPVPAEDDDYRLGYMEGYHWGDEGDFRWHKLEPGIVTVAGRFRRNRHRHPMFVLENLVTGESFIGQLAFSGGYAFEFDHMRDRLSDSAVAFSAKIDAPAPLVVIEPGQRFESPSMHLGCVFGGLDAAVNAMHEHVRKSVLYPPTRGVTGWIETGIGPEYDMSRESTLFAMDMAKKYGSELFYIDAAWYTPPKQEGEWWNQSGNWRYNAERYPNGIGEMREEAHKRGLLFGMWMDAERVGPGSEIWQQHAEMIARTYADKPNPGGLLDHTDEAVCGWMKKQIEYLINEYKIDMFRLDHNVDGPGGVNVKERDGYLENTYLRYYENVYRMYGELRRAYPNVVFENCAGGGGRTDLGLAGRFTHSWVTDYQLHPNALRITNGMTMALPPECVDRLIGGQNAYVTADFDLEMRNLMFAHPTFGGIQPERAETNPEQLARIRHYTDLYKNFVRPMHRDSWIYHHTPELRPSAAQGFAILEMAKKDGARGMLGVFQMASPDKAEITVRPRGVDVSKTYRVTFDNSGATCEISGWTLDQTGVTVRLDGALTSELILYEAK